jgi:hypothetical protein
MPPITRSSRNEFLKLSSIYINSLPKNIKDAIKYYTLHGEYINNYLEKSDSLYSTNTESEYGSDSDSNESMISTPSNYIELIDIAFKNAPRTTTPITVYRGLIFPYIRQTIKGIYPNNFLDRERYVIRSTNYLFGYNAKYNGYISTTLDKHIAETYFYSPNNRSVILEIEIPIGSPVLYIGKNSEHEENEILLPRGSVLETVGFKREKKRDVNILKAKLVLE